MATYLMTEHYAHHRGSFDCVDKDPESVPGSAGNADESFFIPHRDHMRWLALSPVCGREGDHLCSVHEVEQCAVMNRSIRHCMHGHVDV